MPFCIWPSTDAADIKLLCDLSKTFTSTRSLDAACSIQQLQGHVKRRETPPRHRKSAPHPDPPMMLFGLFWTFLGDVVTRAVTFLRHVIEMEEEDRKKQKADKQKAMAFSPRTVRTSQQGGSGWLTMEVRIITITKITKIGRKWLHFQKSTQKTQN